VRPEPPLFPADRERRARVEEAERWGERVFQPVPRRLFRHLLLTSEPARLWMGTDVMQLPAVRALAPLFLPVIRHLACVSDADDARVREDIARLPELLDHVDRLIADDTIGAAEPNAADFQILASVGVLRAFADLGHQVRGRPCEAPARRLYPDWPAIPSGLPVS
jgi:glutathione S-transferase